MYFEFEVANGGDFTTEYVNSTQLQSSNALRNDEFVSNVVNEKVMQSSDFVGSTYPRCLPRRNLLDSSKSPLSSSPLSSSDKQANFLLPLKSPPPSPITAQRQRRYSVHASSTPVPLDSLHDNGNVSFCDLALITKKKIMQLNSKTLIEEIPNVDAKLSPVICKPSNKDLRREVLLTSMQRSLSASSDDLTLSPNTSNKITEVGDMLKPLGDQKNAYESGDQPMEIASSRMIQLANGNTTTTTSPLISANDDIMSECYNLPYEMKSKSPISRIRARRNLSASYYMPQENQNNYMNSSTTFTSTTSMAGARNGVTHSRNYISKKISSMNLLSVGSGNGANSSYYSSNSVSPNLMLTMSSSSFDTPLKKRLHCTSPSKYSPSPYHTMSNSICKDLNQLIFANVSTPLSPDWDMTIKRLKVMHCDLDPHFTGPNLVSADERIDSAHRASIEQTEERARLISDSASLPPFVSSAVQPESELNQLAQDFNRLKTPFT